MDKTTMLLTEHCRFHFGDAPDAWQAWYDDSNWKSVILPHDWSVSLPFSREYSSGTGYLSGGIGWYRLYITPQKQWQGKKISIIFDGIYKNSRIWCNSYYLGQRPNGYISFSYDITEQFRFDRDNVIAVRVDHTDISDSRWFTGSGITRQVHLVIEEAIHPVYNGVFFSTPKVNEQFAAIHVSNELINTLSVDTAVTVINTLLDKDGDPVAEGSTEAILPAGKETILITDFSLENPSLWDCCSPSLYTLKTSLSYKSPEGSPVLFQADLQKVGIRSFTFDPDNGFFLNHKAMLIKGVCIHHDAGCLGAAVYAPVWRRRLFKLKAMGCNAIRMSHNPHMPQLYDLCDELGFLVMDEAFDEWEGPKNKWWQGHNVYPPRNQGYYIDFPQWHKQDLTDLIRRDRNHPSIILWSIGNEIDYPNDPYCHPSFATMTGNNDANKPAAERQYNPLRPNAERLSLLAERLCHIVRENDSTRPVTLAAAFPELSSKLGFLDSLDVVGYNYKEHLYEEGHFSFPDKPFLGSENGHSLSAWKTVTDTPYVSGQFLWTGIDYLGEAHGWPIHGSSAGLLTMAGFEKPGYYRRQSLWSEVPMLYLATASWPHNAKNRESIPEFLPVFRNWNYPEASNVLIKCYTNLPEVEFFLNGRSLGVYAKENKADCISFILPFEAGELTARSFSASSSVLSTEDTLATTGCACQTAIFSTYEKLPDTDFLLYQTEVTMLDSASNPVYSDNSLLHIQIENGNLLGIENGDLSDITDYTASFRRAYHGQLLLYILSRDTASAPVITITGENISPRKEQLNF